MNQGLHSIFYKYSLMFFTLFWIYLAFLMKLFEGILLNIELFIPKPIVIIVYLVNVAKKRNLTCKMANNFLSNYKLD